MEIERMTYKITAELDLKKIIAESREVAQVFNELADNLESIEKKYAEQQESETGMSEEISREEIAALLARESEEQA